MTNYDHTVPTLSIHLRFAVHGLPAVGGILCSDKSRDARGTRWSAKIHDLVEAVSGFIPRTLPVEISQHNGGGLDIRSYGTCDWAVPSDRVRPAVSYEVILSSSGGITDKLWADVVLALREYGYTVTAKSAPSSHHWSYGPCSFKQATVTDDESIALVERSNEEAKR